MRSPCCRVRSRRAVRRVGERLARPGRAGRRVRAVWGIAIARPGRPGGGAGGLRRHRALRRGPGDRHAARAERAAVPRPLDHRQRRPAGRSSPGRSAGPTTSSGGDRAPGRSGWPRCPRDRLARLRPVERPATAASPPGRSRRGSRWPCPACSGPTITCSPCPAWRLAVAVLMPMLAMRAPDGRRRSRTGRSAATDRPRAAPGRGLGRDGRDPGPRLPAGRRPRS